MGRKKKDNGETVEQADLIPDLHPKNSKEIIRLARAYKRAQAARTEALSDEVALKEKLLAQVKQAEIQPNQDGSFKFKCDGAVISVTPRDELVRVKFEDEGE